LPGQQKPPGHHELANRSTFYWLNLFHTNLKRSFL
jgi:hypothetical protein